MNQLVEAVNTVTNWYGLGLRLGIAICKLRGIELTFHMHGLDRLKTEMLNLWLNSSPDATWGDLITALRAMDENRVASDIEAVYSPTTSNGMLLLS